MTKSKQEKKRIYKDLEYPGAWILFPCLFVLFVMLRSIERGIFDIEALKMLYFVYGAIAVIVSLSFILVLEDIRIKVEEFLREWSK